MMVTEDRENVNDASAVGAAVNNKTLEDIAAEIRRAVEYMGDDLPYTVSAGTMRRTADCIEAAAKRDAAIHAMTVEANERLREHLEIAIENDKRTAGNAAEMREALCDILTAAFAAILCYGNSDKEMQRLAICADNARDALSAPARNCDLPLVVDGPADNNADKAWWVFKQAHPDAYFDVPGLLRCIEWLLAPVAGQKGEGDGSK